MLINVWTLPLALPLDYFVLAIDIPNRIRKEQHISTVFSVIGLRIQREMLRVIGL